MSKSGILEFADTAPGIVQVRRHTSVFRRAPDATAKVSQGDSEG